MAEVENSVITQEMRDVLGVEGAPATLEVDKTSVRMFARAVGYTDMVFYDEEEAKRRGYRSLPAPPGYLGTRVFVPSSGPAEMPMSEGRRYTIPYKRVLNGGTEIEYFDDICAGDILTSRSKVASFNETKGSLGPMLITTTETNFTNQDGKRVAVMRGTSINY